jgi:hypothetical protein
MGIKEVTCDQNPVVCYDDVVVFNDERLRLLERLDKATALTHEQMSS